jgi:hypothetical protein
MTTCADCGKEEERGGGFSLKACKSCMSVKYCNAACQRNHWPKHKTACKLRAAELRDEALFKDPPPKEDCPICFLPMPIKIISCVSLPPATILSVPIYDFANEHEELADEDTEAYFPCCGKSICKGCLYSYSMNGKDKCPFCNAERLGKTDVEKDGEVMKRAETNDPASIYMLANFYRNGRVGLQQDHAKAMELCVRAADLGYSKAHNNLGKLYHEGENMKKAKFHFEAAAMAGHNGARNNLGCLEYNSGNEERAMKHLTIAASAGDYYSMHELGTFFEKGCVSRESINSTLEAYNNSCAEMRSENRDAYIRTMIESIKL